MSTGLLTLLVGGGIAYIFDYFHFDRFVEDLELKTYDLRTVATLGNQRQDPSQDILIVKFDDLALNMFEPDFGTWPWPRKVHADLVRYMNENGARMIAYDLMFTARQKSQEDSDLELIDAFKNEKNLYLSMNLDNNLQMFEAMGRGLKAEDWSWLKPYSVDVVNHLDPRNPALKLDKTGFYSNDTLQYNHFRALLPDLMQVGERIAMINHGRDSDGISRGNPLVYRLIHYEPLQTSALPLQPGNRPNTWVDADGKPVTEQGLLLDQQGHTINQIRYSYYPYMALRLILDLKYPNARLPLTLDEQGHLKFGKHDVPLSANGQFLVRWRNANFRQHLLEEEAHRLELIVQNLKRNPSRDPQRRMSEKQQIAIVEEQLVAYHEALNQPFPFEPYQELSVANILTAMHHERAGKLEPMDRFVKQSLRNKVIFVGATALASYDIKSTPVNPVLPGVLIQAQVFDNLLNNSGYLVRVTPAKNTLVTIFLALLAGLVTFRMRSANAGMLTASAIAATYTVIATLLFKAGIWVNIVMPLVVLVISVLISFMAKYIVKNKDYERTYALATTDSMTGLYNHRFFQEQLSKQIEQCKRFNQKFSLVLIDIDFFKKFNDSYGHQAGDEVLRCVARKLTKSVRMVDIVARYGGEEMAVILDRANEQEGLEVARKLVREIASEAYPISEGVSKHVTISVGVSTFPTHGQSPAELIEFSDKGLYRAKENGRNQVGAQYDGEASPSHAEHPPESQAG